MKINLCVEKPAISGYNNIDLSTQEVDLNNMNNLCEASECTELLLDETLNYIPIQNIEPLLNRLKTRMRKRGKIIVSGFDVDECVKTYCNGILSITDLNNILYGSGKIKKCSCMSYLSIKNILTDNNFTISVELNTGKFIITAQRIS